MTDQQAVAPETDAEAKPSVEESSAQDDLDTILAEFDESEPVKESEQPAPDKSAQPDSEVVEWVKAQKEKEIRENTKRDLQTATNWLKESVGETPVDVPEELLEGLLYKRAEDDPRIMKAWVSRNRNPQAWEKTVRALGKEVAKKFTPTDRQATDSWDAVDSAVHRASTSKSYEAPTDLGSMTDQEFARYKAGLSKIR